MAQIVDGNRLQWPLGGDEIDELCAEFAACDTDGDGRVTLAEFESLLQSVGSLVPKEKRRSEFLRIDADGNGLIDLAEFRYWWLG
jgi:Ca2+-binding EF-hand superfamily protein